MKRAGSYLHDALYRLDAVIDATQRALRRTLGRAREHRIAPYRGWATRDKAVILARVVEDDVALQRRLAKSSRLLRVTYERFGTLEVPEVPVRVSWQGRTMETASNPAGFVDVSFPTELPAGPTRATLELTDGGGGAAEVEVFALKPQATLGFISDVDDTVLETELQNPWRRALQLVYARERMRPPFDGIAALFQAFAQRGNPVFYVSNAPWNLHDHLAALLDHHEIPRGPLLLRDIRLAERPSPTAGGAVHKQVALRRLIEDHSGLTFVLLGDSTRRDPLRYVEVAEAYPGRVAAIYIRKMAGLLARSAQDLDELAARARRVGVELVVAEDTVTIAGHAASRGFIPGAEVGHVREGQREDEQTPEPGVMGATS